MSGFDEVAGIIGRALDGAFKNAMQEILDAANSSGPTPMALGGISPSISLPQLSDFFRQLGGIDAEIQFLSKVPKPGGSFIIPAVIRPSALPAGEVGILAVDISIGIGIKIGF